MVVLIGKSLSNVLAKMPLPDEVLDLVFQVMTFFCVVVVFLVETVISPLVASLGLCSDWVGGPEELLVLDLEEDLCACRIEGRRWSGRRWLWPIHSPPVRS
ncbi:hypothetical protein B296_00014803 [Ensete ventricosum]|uniref:Uncharacterized protein n=1 Tax=Ensete ventricosum TaxID=4639 RepID=A0A427AUP2_ENSVE|nr:hypothetical protein B296_00014803 [Ensete ventricosum]